LHDRANREWNDDARRIDTRVQSLDELVLNQVLVDELTRRRMTVKLMLESPVWCRMNLPRGES
jgi:hypothetical protein